MWLAMAVPAVGWLWARRSVRTPPGFGMWALFVGWMLLSGSQLASFADVRPFVVRAAIYVAAGILFVFAYNLPPGHSIKLRRALVFFFGFIIATGIAAIVLPVSDFATPFERALPRSIASFEFVRQMVHGHISQTHVFLGFPVNRPAAPFAFTNEWGSGVGILAPIAAYGVSRARAGTARRLAIVGALLAMVPIIYSLNRGLWLSLAVAVVYVSIRLAVHGRARPLINVIGATVVLAGLILMTPLGSLAAERLDTGHSDDRRADLVGQSVATTLEAPLFGHGGPVIDIESPDRAPIGTHGQIYLLGVSHGIPGALAYLATLGVVLIRSRRGGPDTAAFWANAAIFVALTQVAFYSHLQVQIHLIMLIAALAVRDPEYAGSTGGTTS
jgi:hypothetical protein